MNQEEKKVGLSIKAVGEEASRAEVESYKESNKGKGGHGHGQSSSSGSSSSTTLGDLLKWKQSENEDNN
jgi:small subunit ribosomal protein S1